jgi:hypothetical protein
MLGRNRKHRPFESHFGKSIRQPCSLDTGKPLVKLDQPFEIPGDYTNRGELHFELLAKKGSSV